MYPVLLQPFVNPVDTVKVRVLMCDACCCGDARFDGPRTPMPKLKAAVQFALKAAGGSRRVAVKTTGCLGPCAIGNNIVIATAARNQLFKKMNSIEEVRAVAGYAMAVSENPGAAIPDELMPNLEEQFSL